MVWTHVVALQAIEMYLPISRYSWFFIHISGFRI